MSSPRSSNNNAIAFDAKSSLDDIFTEIDQQWAMQVTDASTYDEIMKIGLDIMRKHDPTSCIARHKGIVDLWMQSSATQNVRKIRITLVTKARKEEQEQIALFTNITPRTPKHDASQITFDNVKELIKTETTPLINSIKDEFAKFVQTYVIKQNEIKVDTSATLKPNEIKVDTSAKAESAPSVTTNTTITTIDGERIQKPLDWADRAAEEEQKKIQQQKERQELIQNMTYAQRIQNSNATVEELRKVIPADKVTVQKRDNVAADVDADGFVTVHRPVKKQKAQEKRQPFSNHKSIMSANILFNLGHKIKEEEDIFAWDAYYVEQINGVDVKVPNVKYIDEEGNVHPGWFKVAHRAYKINHESKLLHVIADDGTWNHYEIKSETTVINRDNKKRTYPNEIIPLTNEYVKWHFNPKKRDYAMPAITNEIIRWNDIRAQ